MRNLHAFFYAMKTLSGSRIKQSKLEPINWI